MRTKDIEAVVLVFRDASCVLATQRVSGSWARLIDRRDNNDICADEAEWLSRDLIATWQLSAEAVAEHAQEMSTPWAAISYEGAIQNRRVHLVQCFERLGLDPSRYQFFQREHHSRQVAIPWDQPVSSAAVDGNAKWVVGPSLREAIMRVLFEVHRKMFRGFARRLSNRLAQQRPGLSVAQSER